MEMFDFYGSSWVNANNISPQNIPEHIAKHIFQSGSLISNLEKVINSNIEVKPINKGWIEINSQEKELLQTKDTIENKFWCRDVTISTKEKHLIFARSIFSNALTNNEEYSIQDLGETPLSKILFGDTPAERTEMLVGSTNHSKIIKLIPQITNLDINPDIQNNATIWGRVSKFILNNNPLIIYEFFLY